MMAVCQNVNAVPAVKKLGTANTPMGATVAKTANSTASIKRYSSAKGSSPVLSKSAKTTVTKKVSVAEEARFPSVFKKMIQSTNNTTTNPVVTPGGNVAAVGVTKDELDSAVAELNSRLSALEANKNKVSVVGPNGNETGTAELRVVE